MQIRQARSVKWDCSPPEHLVFQKLNQSASNSPAPELRQYIDSDLPKQFCIRRTTRQPDNGISLHCPNRQHIRPPRQKLFTQGIGKRIPSIQIHNRFLFKSFYLKISIRPADFCFRKKHMMALPQPLSMFLQLRFQFHQVVMFKKPYAILARTPLSEPPVHTFIC